MKLLLWWCHIRSDMVSKDSMQRICSGEEGKIEDYNFQSIISFCKDDRSLNSNSSFELMISGFSSSCLNEG